jgi:hypothetical protein
MENSQVHRESFALLGCESHHRDSGDKSLERAFQSLSLKQHLEAFEASRMEDAKLVFLPGAGAVYMPGCKFALVEDRWLALFVGCATLPHRPLCNALEHHLCPGRSSDELTASACACREIENYSYLVKKYCLTEAGLDPSGSYLLETVRELSTLNDAQVCVPMRYAGALEPSCGVQEAP